MAEKHPLMKPLGSADLKPRVAAQASFAAPVIPQKPEIPAAPAVERLTFEPRVQPQAALPVEEVPAPAEIPAVPEMPEVPEIPAAPAVEHPAFEPRVQPQAALPVEEVPAPVEIPAVPEVPETPEIPEVPEAPAAVEAPLFDLSLFESFQQETADDDEDIDTPDAMPSERMPEPACVSLFAVEEPPKPQKSSNKNWLWVPVVLMVFAAFAAAWYFGLVSKLYAFIVDKTSSMQYNLGTITFSFQPKM